MHVHAVDTPVGALHGRDCIHLDSVSFTDRTHVLVIRGEINGDLCERRSPGSFLPFEVHFSGLLALRMIELDSWNWSGASCFDEVVDSPWIAELGGKVTAAHRHFVLQTYYDVFDVVCEDFDIAVELNATSEGPVTSRLVSAGNVLVPAILLLEREGWRVEHDPSREVTTWTARRGSTELAADDPLELVALAAISDAHVTDHRIG
jgi:hypothetical protein